MSSNNVKKAYFPKAYAEKLGRLDLWADDRENRGELDTPVKVYPLKLAEKFIAAHPQLAEAKITERDKGNAPGVTVAAFLRNAAKRSESQGYLSMSDLKELANVAAQISPSVGSVPFRNAVGRLVALGCIACDRGNKAKDLTDTSGVDWASFSLDDDDDDDDTDA